MDRDRFHLLNEAIDDELEVQKWQLEGIRQAIAEADAGQFATEAEVKAAFGAFKRPPPA
jgi:predicted transcriptional regulator